MLASLPLLVIFTLNRLLILNMMFRLLTALFLTYACCAQTQPIARFTLTAVNNSIAAPVYINLDGITALDAGHLKLVKRSGKKIQDIPFQIENGYRRFLWWMVSKDDGQKKQIFELVQVATPVNHSLPASVTKSDGKLALIATGKKLLQYQFGEHYPPAGVDTVFKRSGFIHPLWSPSGNVLTQINPADHYHHLGIWNPWTHVQFQGRDIDFWNLGEKKGTVRFSRFIETYKGAVYSGFKALQEHVALNLPVSAQETVVMNETWDVRAFAINDRMWICDFVSSLQGATDSLVILKEYRYGGFGFRATAAWNNTNSKVLTSEGKTRKDADASVARWCKVEGNLGNGNAGILFMSYPSNFNHPEPMRVWPEDANKRGDVFFSFSPTRNMDWVLKTGETHVLKYRMLVYDGDLDIQEAEQAWNCFAAPPQVLIERMNKNQY